MFEKYVCNKVITQKGPKSDRPSLFQANICGVKWDWIIYLMHCQNLNLHMFTFLK